MKSRWRERYILSPHSEVLEISTGVSINKCKIDLCRENGSALNGTGIYEVKIVQLYLKNKAPSFDSDYYPPITLCCKQAIDQQIRETEATPGGEKYLSPKPVYVPLGIFQISDLKKKEHVIHFNHYPSFFIADVDDLGNFSSYNLPLQRNI